MHVSKQHQQRESVCDVQRTCLQCCNIKRELAVTSSQRCTCPRPASSPRSNVQIQRPTPIQRPPVQHHALSLMQARAAPVPVLPAPLLVQRNAIVQRPTPIQRPQVHQEQQPHPPRPRVQRQRPQVRHHRQHIRVQQPPPRRPRVFVPNPKDTFYCDVARRATFNLMRGRMRRMLPWNSNELWTRLVDCPKSRPVPQVGWGSLRHRTGTCLQLWKSFTESLDAK